MAEIKAGTRIGGLIGNPVEHSLSPLIHNTLSKMTGIDMVYGTFKVENDNLDAAVKGAYALNMIGMNVTVPHKCNVMSSLVEVDELAAQIGAVNTLVRTGGGFKGYNTDYIGLKRQLDMENIDIFNREIVIIGAGGASRAVTFMCAKYGALKIYLLNRTLYNAEKLAEDVNAYMGKKVVFPMELKDADKLPDGKFTVIQTTSKGLFPNMNDTPIEDGAFYDKIAHAVDIIFNPNETMFMKLARAHGAVAYNGLGMLLFQGIAAYELWNDVTISEEMAQAVYELLKKEACHE